MSTNSKWVEMSEMEKRPRFQVNRVDGVKGEEEEMDPLQADHEEQEDIEDDDHIGSYAKSFRHFTREALPRMDNYRNIMSIQAAVRPTLEELHNETLHGKGATLVRIKDEGEKEQEGVKFGWIKGVLIRNLLNIWGVMLFLRLSWVVGQAGIWQGVVLISSCSVVTFLTALSMSAISTNGLIKGGGTYFMISRSLGPEFGASIGLIFSLANAVACAMYTVGFCESMIDLLSSYGLSIIDGGVQDTRIIGSITILCLLGIVVIGMEWEAKTQVVLLFILLIAMFDFLIGCFMGPQSDEVRAKGFLGFNGEIFFENLYPNYRHFQGQDHDFFSVFSVFFPAASGFLAGANISGDLKDPQVAIPKGTLLSVIVTTLSYILMAILCGWTVVRDASGDVQDYLNNTLSDCAINGTCKYGLHNSAQVMELVSAFGLLIYLGCFAATISSALASLVSAPKVFQALCKDKLYPYIAMFGRGYGKNQEPVRGYILTFFIALAFILVGELNAIAPLISNFFLAAYALINFSTFHASLVKSVGWRPTFKYYNMWLSLLGACLCVAVMFLISWWTALITLAAVLALYLLVTYRKPDVNWGSSTQAQTYKNALLSVQQLSRVEDHVKNFRPQILLLSGTPQSRPPLIDFGYLMSKNISLLICGNIEQHSLPQRVRSSMTQRSQQWLSNQKIKAFYAHVDGSDFEHGAHALMQACGLGKLKPNIVMMGYKSDWKSSDKMALSMYFNVLHKALDINMALAILRLPEGLDYSHYMKDGELMTEISSSQVSKTSAPMHKINSFSQISQGSSISEVTPPSTPINRTTRPVNGNPDPKDNINASKPPGILQDPSEDCVLSEVTSEILNNITQFQRKQKKGIIDVWWLYDDGGLTLLLPYIISTRRNWSECKLRVFTLANKKDDLLYEQRSMASLLSKFRIDYSDLKVIPDITKKPQEESIAFFENLIKDVLITDNEDDTYGVAIGEAELLAMKDKTNRHLRLRELMHEYSMNSNLVVMTLPMPRKNVVTACLYMAWLETLTKDMPPFLLVRGNQQSVLTFYS